MNRLDVYFDDDGTPRLDTRRVTADAAVRAIADLAEAGYRATALPHDPDRPENDPDVYKALGLAQPTPNRF